MIGCNGHEGALYTLGPLSSMNLSNYQTTKESIKLFVHAIGNIKDMDGLCDALMHEYIGMERADITHQQFAQGMIQMFGDTWFLGPSFTSIKAYSGKMFE